MTSFLIVNYIITSVIKPAYAEWLKALPTVRKIWDSIPRTVKLDAESPTSRYRCYVSSYVCCPAAEMGPATRYTESGLIMSIKFF